jgi:hypothetical protein
MNTARTCINNVCSYTISAAKCDQTLCMFSLMNVSGSPRIVKFTRVCLYHEHVNVRHRVHKIRQSWDGSVSIAIDYGLDDRMIGVRIPAGAGYYFSLRHRVQSGSGAHPASYTVGIWDSFPGNKAAGK